MGPPGIFIAALETLRLAVGRLSGDGLIVSKTSEDKFMICRDRSCVEARLVLSSEVGDVSERVDEAKSDEAILFLTHSDFNPMTILRTNRLFREIHERLSQLIDLEFSD